MAMVTWDTADDRTAHAQDSSRGGAAVFWFFVVETICILFLQKLGLPVADAVVEVILPVTYVGLVFMMFNSRLHVDRWRVILYVIFAAIFFASNALRGGSYSSNSVLLTLAIYLPFVFSFDVDADVYKRCLRFFLNMMLIICGLELLQHAIQLTMGWRAIPDLDKMIPTDYLMQNFVYVQPIYYGAQYVKPNAFVLVETSVLSQFLALALAIEYIYFKRLWRMILFAVCILVTFAGTGLLLVLICAPVILGRVSARTMLGLLAVAAIVFLVGLQIGWYDQVHQRFTEFAQVGSSGHHRFVMPLEGMRDFAERPNALFTGIGAGAIIKDPNFVWWPVAKVSIEDGFLAAVAFFAFLIYACYVQAPSKRIAFAVLVYYNLLGGGFAIPFYAFTCLLFCSLFRVRPAAPRKAVPAPTPTGLGLHRPIRIPQAPRSRPIPASTS